MNNNLKILSRFCQSSVVKCNKTWVIYSAQPTAAEDEDDESEDTTETNLENETIGGYNTADILAAVNASAEEGIALLSSWLGLAGNNSQNGTVTDQAPQTNQHQ